MKLTKVEKCKNRECERWVQRKDDYIGLGDCLLENIIINEDGTCGCFSFKMEIGKR